MAGEPTITVSADPAALKAAMDALEQFNKARETYGREVGLAKGKLDKAQQDYEAAEQAALAKLEEAQKVAAKAGVNFSGTKRRRSSGGTRGPRVSVEEVKEAILALARNGEPFTKKDIPLGTTATQTKAIEALMESNKLTETDPIKPEGARGRAAAAWKLA